MSAGCQQRHPPGREGVGPVHSREVPLPLARDEIGSLALMDPASALLPRTADGTAGQKKLPVGRLWSNAIYAALPSFLAPNRPARPARITRPPIGSAGTGMDG